MLRCLEETCLMAHSETIGGISINGDSLHFEFVSGDGKDIQIDADQFAADVAQAEHDECLTEFTSYLKERYLTTEAAMVADGTYSPTALASRLSADLVGKVVKVDYAASPLVSIT